MITIFTKEAELSLRLHAAGYQIATLRSVKRKFCRHCSKESHGVADPRVV